MTSFDPYELSFHSVAILQEEVAANFCLRPEGESGDRDRAVPEDVYRFQRKADAFIADILK